MTTSPAQKPDGRDRSRDRPGFKVQLGSVDRTNQGGALTSDGPREPPYSARAARLNPQSAIRNRIMASRRLSRNALKSSGTRRLQDQALGEGKRSAERTLPGS